MSGNGQGREKELDLQLALYVREVEDDQVAGRLIQNVNRQHPVVLV